MHEVNILPGIFMTYVNIKEKYVEQLMHSILVW